MSAKTERDFVAADLASVDYLLGKLSGKDVFARLGLQSRRRDLQKQLESLADGREVSASASLFFSGDPVLANRGIEASFGASAMARFQDLVTKIFAVQHTGTLGQRGIVPGKDASKLHITNVVRGSFGFRLEEISSQTNMLESPLKDAVDEASRLMEKFGMEDEEAFESEVENIDGRVLASVKDFFEVLSANHAKFRLVSGNLDKSFGAQSVTRAADRARNTTLDESEVELPGQLAGALRDSRIFEFRPIDGRPAIKGPIGTDFDPDQISQINRELADKDATAKFRVKKVIQNERVLREKYTLVSIHGA
ncbi:MAG TPA: hypothetical protein VGR47_22200 [Terracidiphilus sp.]|nr:hypothetical protein [Terracidiphilus sp.]